MNKQEKTEKLLSNFDLRLSFLFPPHHIKSEATKDGRRYTIKDPISGEFTLHARMVSERGTPPCLNIFARGECFKVFDNANQNTGKYNFFGLDQDGITFYLNSVISKVSSVNFLTTDEDLLAHGIVHESHPYDVRRAKHGFEVYKNGVTHATRCAIIGWHGMKGLRRAIDEINKRKGVINA